MKMEFQLSELLGSSGALDDAAACYAEQGFFVLHGLEQSLTPLFREMLASQIGAGPDQMDEFLDPNGPPTTLPIDIRRRLAQVPSNPDFSGELLQVFGPLLNRLIGPLAHVSHTFHTQYKSPGIAPVDHGGNDNEFLEMQGQYLLHQDFTGASLPTSPSGVTLWVAQNTTSDWRLRIYPGSHRKGLICNQWLPTDDPRAAALGKPFEMEARVGSALVFNALCLHGGCEPGPSRRVSCDIRFFPLCAFLSSPVHVFGENAMADLRARVAAEESPTLRAPLLESLAYMGQPVAADDVAPLSVLNWTNYLHHYLRGSSDEALDYMLRFTNEALEIDDAEAYSAKYHGRPLHSEPLLQVRDVIVAREPEAPELAGLDGLIERLASSPDGIFCAQPGAGD